MTNIQSESKQIDNKKENISSKIVFLWRTLNDEQDLLNLINLVSDVVFEHSPQKNNLKNKTSIIIGLSESFEQKHKKYTLKQLRFNAYSKDDDKLYRTFKIRKKKQGEYRTIDAPNYTLKGIQQCLNYIFQQIYTPNKYAVGFVPKHSIVDGAKVHISQKFIYNIDLKDFFSSIYSGRIYERLLSNPFCLKKTIARLVTNLCCYKNEEGNLVLPQGAPTSPTITNFICECLDQKLSRLAKAYGLKYTRYADDITFSGKRNLFSEDGKFCKSLRNIIEKEELFTINEKKTRLCHMGMRQEVTGLIVNEKVNVSRKYVKQLRAMINNWEKKGYNEAQYIFLNNFARSKEAITKRHNINNITIQQVISGKLNFLGMVKGKNNPTYQKLLCRYENLLGQLIKQNGIQKKDIEEIYNKKELSPKLTADFLSLFNRRDGFKYLTHNYDSAVMSLNELIDLTKHTFEESIKNKNNIPDSLWTLVNNFINGNTWYDYNGKPCDEGYSTQTWLNWSRNNENKHPIMDVGGIENIIQRFRHTIRIIPPDLHTMIEDIIKPFKDSFNFELINLNKADFYTNAMVVRYRIRDIIKDLTDHKVYKNIKIEYQPGLDGEYFTRTIKISQMESFSELDLDNVIKRYNSGGGFFYENADKLKGYCNWFVESLWNGKPYRWNILRDSNTEEKEVISKDKVCGFTHLLTFYYKD